MLIRKLHSFYEKINKNGGPEEDRGFVYVWCEDLKLDKIGLLNLGEYWCWFYNSWKLVTPALHHMVAQFTFGKSLPNAINVDKWDLVLGKSEHAASHHPKNHSG